MPPKAEPADGTESTSSAPRPVRASARASTLEVIPKDIVPGVRVTVLSKFNGIVRFAGETDFAPGNWIGVELDTLDGKNDGSVKGKHYFQCETNRGIFARPNAVKVEALAKLEAAAAASGLSGALPVISEDAASPASPVSPTGAAAQASPASPAGYSPSSPSSTKFTRRESLAPDMQKSSIHVAEGEADMQELLQTCGSEVQRLQGAVERLTAALDTAVIRESKTAPSAPAQQGSSVESSPDFEAWLQAASSRIEQRLEERLQKTLQEQVEAVVAGPLQELQAATEELQKLQAERQKAQR